jgi:hypothetical protein
VINAKSSSASIRRTIGSIFLRRFILGRAQKRLAHRVITLVAQIARGYSGHLKKRNITYAKEREAAITLWNTVYLERAAEALAKSRTVEYALFGVTTEFGV